MESRDDWVQSSVTIEHFGSTEGSIQRVCILLLGGLNPEVYYVSVYICI